MLKVSIRQVKAACALLAWSREDLASRSGIDPATIRWLEGQDGELTGSTDAGDAIYGALEAAGIIFMADDGEGPGVRLGRQSAQPAPDNDLVVEFDQNSGECFARCAGERKFIGVFETRELAETAAEEYQRELEWHQAKLAHPKG